MLRRPTPALRFLASLALGLGLAPGARAELVAERITLANAADRLFGGTDADGGIEDWYLSNGIVEAIIDDVGPQDDLPPGVTAPPKQSEAAFSGGTLIDLGLVGANSDQLAQMFTVGGLSTKNFVVYDTIAAETTAERATIRCTGRVLGFEPVQPSELPVETEYSVAPGDSFVTITTTVTNQGSEPAFQLGGFLDVFVWTGRSELPFSPLPGRGFDHKALDLAHPTSALELPVFAAAPGTIGPDDGINDPVTGAPSGEVAYGILGVEASLDEDGDGPMPPFISGPVNSLFGISSHDITAFGNPPLTLGDFVPGAVATYERRIYVGARNDVASVANPMILELASERGFETGTLSGDVDAADGADVAASVVATRTGGPAIPGFANSAPITQFRTDASGAFSGVVLPEGTYDLEVRSPERDPVTVKGVAVSAGQNTAVTVPPLSGLGTVEIELVEKRKGPDLPIPGKAVFHGSKGAPDPQLGLDVLAFELGSEGDTRIESETFGGSTAQGSTVYVGPGTSSVRLRPGRYDVYGSRGPEYSVDRESVVVKAGQTKKVKLAVVRQLETPNALSGDFHIHSARSLDTQAGVQSRVPSFAGEGVEVMVSTDHDFQLDYRPVIDALGLGSFVSSIVGVEVTGSVPNPPAFPNSFGHINAWPMTVDPTAQRDGAIEDEFVAPNWIFSRLRGRGAEVIQYNHPRAGVSGLTSIGIFNNIGCSRCKNAIDQACTVDDDCPADPAPRSCTCVGYQPDRALTAPPNDELLSADVTGGSGVANPNPKGRNIDFDVLEIGNGISAAGYIETRADWLSLLDQANAPAPGGPVPVLPGSGVSDSHRNTIEAPGYFRTYVLGVGDDPAALDQTAFDDAVRAGHMVPTTGPYIELEVRDGAGGSAGVGETLVPSGSSLTLHIRVQAASWVPVDEVRVVVNGEVRPELTFDATTKPKVKKRPKNPWSASRKAVQRFEADVPLALTGQDLYLLVEAGAKLDPVPAPDAEASLLVPGYVSLAFTNPVFVDVGGDGFSPPGVSALATARALAPLRTPAGRAALAAQREHERRAHPAIYRLQIPAEAARSALGR